MKIVIIQGAFLPIPPIQGGAVEKIWFKMGQEFAINGHEVIHISKSIKDFPVTEEIHGVQHIRVKGYKTPKSLFILKLLDLFYSICAINKVPNNVDIVVTNTFWCPILLRGNLGKKVYVDVQRVPRWQMRLYTHVLRYRANSKPVYLAIKQEIASKYHGKVSLIPNPLTFNNLSNVILKEKKEVVLYVGRIHPEKGLDILIKSFKLINSHYELRIIGPWDVPSGGGGEIYYEYLKSLVSDTNNIYFLGAIYNETILNSHYEEASIFVYPSIAEQGETFGLAPLEAMSWGCVPIVSNLECFSDFIIPFQNGLSFDYRDERVIEILSNLIKLLQEDNSLRIKLSIEAFKVNNTHSQQSIAKLFLNDFENNVNERI